MPFLITKICFNSVFRHIRRVESSDVIYVALSLLVLRLLAKMCQSHKLEIPLHGYIPLQLEILSRVHLDLFNALNPVVPSALSYL